MTTSTPSHRHVGLTVEDLEPSLISWRDALGLVLVSTQTIRGGHLEAITQEPGAVVKQAHLQFPDDGAPSIELLEYVAPQGQPLAVRPAVSPPQAPGSRRR